MTLMGLVMFLKSVIKRKKKSLKMIKKENNLTMTPK
jgi:hypothetical protein